MRKQTEIEKEIKALKSLIPAGIWKAKTARSIELAIEELKFGYDQTSEEFEELDSSHQDILRQTNDWKTGMNDEPVSKGWGSLVT